jgi:hypothetical protein
MIEGIGNVLIARHCFEMLPTPYFDPLFGLSGGEDKEFFVRLRAKGAHFARADDAVVYEYVPASRTSLSWLLMRTYRVGNTDMRIALKHREGRNAIAREIAKIAAALLSVPILSIIFSATPEHRLDGIRKLYRAAGKIGALIGHHYHEYANTHGR